MAIIGWPELILVLAILVFLFGATKMKDLAKGLGESVKAFKKATDETPDKNENRKEAILDIAQKMGIKTEGKDINEILKEIEAKSSKGET